MQKIQIKEKIKNSTVLFVDDEELVTEIMKNILPYLFKEVYYATNGEEGIQTFSNSPTDLIITDISMPKIDGMTMVKTIRNKHKDIKCIFLSGHNEEAFLQQCINENSHYIIKPISSKLLYEAFDKLF